MNKLVNFAWKQVVKWKRCEWDDIIYADRSECNDIQNENDII